MAKEEAAKGNATRECATHGGRKSVAPKDEGCATNSSTSLMRTFSRARLPRTLAAFALVIAIGTLPPAALATESGEQGANAQASETVEASAASQAADTTGSNSASNSSASQSMQPEALYGIYAAKDQQVTINEQPVETSRESACGAFADNGGTIVASALSAITSGDKSAALSTGATGGNLSVANSSLITKGSSSPLMKSSGVIEIDNVIGEATKSPIAFVEKAGAIRVAHSTLASAEANAGTGQLPTCAIALYRSESTDGTAGEASASFQASDSTIRSSIQSGSLFYLTNTAANILLANVSLDFDNSKAKLLVASSGVADGLGTAGKDGASVTFTNRKQKISGSVEADTISSIDMYLLEGSSWNGAASITANSNGTQLSSNIVVNIDATSKWTVTTNSTVSYLNIEKGGALVDEKGKAVMITDKDGNKLVDGASDVKVTVTGEFSTAVKTSDANVLKAGSIDRTAFDEQFDTSTAFGTNGAVPTDEQRAEELKRVIIEWFDNLG